MFLLLHNNISHEDTNFFSLFVYLHQQKHSIMRYRFLLSIILFVLSVVSASADAPMRKVYNINDNWRFYHSEQLDNSNVDYISLPHTWQAELGSYGKGSSMANYTRTLSIPQEWMGRRLFLRFEGVQSVARVFVNGAYVGGHKGGFTAFTLEITENIRFGAENYIRVVVGNAMRSDVLPVSTDMDLTAGIFRDVELVVAPRNMISMEHYGSEGIFVVQQSVDKELVKGFVRSYISAQPHSHLDLSVRIVGPDGYEIMTNTTRIGKHEESYVDTPFEIHAPQLWSPKSPALYRVEVSLGDDKYSDAVVVETGFREVSLNGANDLCINGEAVAVRGVNLSHDRMGYGMAISDRSLGEDYAILSDMGATALRSLSGPHSSELYDWCDRDGRLVWIDMPFTRSEAAFSDICYYPVEEFHANGREQLAEIIAQNFNHPSVVMWGLFSLVWQHGDSVIEYVKELNELAHKIDPTRLTAGCSNTDGDINFITDIAVLRQNVGWQKGQADDVAVWCRQLASKREWRTAHFGVCYGEEGATEHTAERITRAQRGTRYLPARRQTYMHERYHTIIDSMGNFCGVWLNNMFDYASARRPYSLNRSGLVEYDHSTKKDAYYLYRAVWNESVPTLHIADGEWTQRADTLQNFTIYSSVGTPALLVNGDSVNVRRTTQGIYHADSVVIRGRATIEAVDSTGAYRHKVDIRCGSMLD